MKRVIFVTLLFVSTVCLANEALPIWSDIIKSKGKCSFTDGSSIYQFSKDGSFVLEPVGLSGRTINGVWKSTESNIFVITGKWGWVNGMSRTDDYRELTLCIYPHSDKLEVNKSTQNLLKTVEVYPVYFTIEKLSEITKAEYDIQIESNQRVDLTR